MSVPSSPVAPREHDRMKRHALPALPTAEVVLRPSFVDALQQIAPKRRRPKALYALLAVAVALGVAIGVSPSLRASLVAQGKRLVSSPTASAAAVDPSSSVAPASTAADPAAVASASPLSSASATPSAPVAVAPVVALPAASAQPSASARKQPRWRRGSH